MNKIHPNSQITTIPDLDIFDIYPTQLTKDKTYYNEYRPLSAVESNQQIEFVVQSAIDEYINLRDTLFYIRFKVDIKKTGTGDITEEDWKKIQPINNLLHSLFKTVNVEIEGKSITQAPQTYAYKAFFESCLGYTEEAKMGFLTASLWYNDENAKTSLNETQSKKIRPSTIATDGTGKWIDLCGKLHIDLAQQPKSLIGGLKMKFTLYPNDPKFYLWTHDNTIIPTVSFSNAALYVNKSKIAYPVVEAQNLAIAKSPAKYPIMRGEVKTFQLNDGTLDVNLDNIITGQIPRRMFVALVDSRGFSDNLLYNPFNFQHFNLNYLSASVDGIQYPTLAFTPNFTDNLYVREFLSIYDTLNQLTSDTTVTIAKDEFSKGNAIYGFHFGQDNIEDVYKSGYFNPINHGSVSLNMKFSNALTNNINVLVYCEYDNLVQIDATRNAITDYI